MVFVRARILLLLVLSNLFLECNYQPTKLTNYGAIKMLGGMHLSPLADSIFQIELKRSPDALGYAIFIDKKSEGLSDFVITVAPVEKRFKSLYESGASSYFMLNDSTPVFIYTGIDDFLVNDSAQFSDSKKLPPYATGEFKNIDYYSKFISINEGISYTHFDTSTYLLEEPQFPFSAIRQLRPTVYFAIPDSNMQ